MDTMFSHTVFNKHPFPNCETQPPRCQLCAIVRLFITNRNIDLHNVVLLRDAQKLVVAVDLASNLNPIAILFKETQKPYTTDKHFKFVKPIKYFRDTITKLKKQGRIIMSKNKYRYSHDEHLRISILALSRFCSKPPTVDFGTDTFLEILQSHNLRKETPLFNKYNNPNKSTSTEEASVSQHHHKSIAELEEEEYGEQKRLQRKATAKLRRHQAKKKHSQ